MDRRAGVYGGDTSPMHVLADEHLQVRFAQELDRQLADGGVCTHAVRAGFGGLANGELQDSAIAANYDALVTSDMNMPFQTPPRLPILVITATNDIQMGITHLIAQSRPSLLCSTITPPRLRLDFIPSSIRALATYSGVASAIRKSLCFWLLHDSFFLRRAMSILRWPSFGHCLTSSLLGLLGFLHRRGRKLTHSDFMPSKLQSMPGSAPSKVDLKDLSKVFTALRKRELLPWPSMDKCTVRSALDDVAAGLDKDQATDWRARLANEPSIQATE